MNRLLALTFLPLLAGCFTSNVPAVSRWSVDYRAGTEAAGPARYGVGRVTQVTVRAPYGVENLAVLRADGSIAFDDYNLFAAAPAQMLRGVTYDALVQSGLFKSVVNASSLVAAPVSVEVMVTKLALDCRRRDPDRQAEIELVVRLVDGGELVAVGKASAAVSARERGFGEAFSIAASRALDEALRDLK